MQAHSAHCGTKFLFKKHTPTLDWFNLCGEILFAYNWAPGKCFTIESKNIAQNSIDLKPILRLQISKNIPKFFLHLLLRPGRFEIDIIPLVF